MDTDAALMPRSTVPSRARGIWYPWVVVAVLMLLYTCSFIDRTILNLMVMPIRSDLGISDSQFSYLTGFAFVIMYSVAGIPMGSMVDRWSRRWLIAIGVTAWSAMTALCGLVGGYWQLFVARVGVGIGEATLSPAAYSLVSDYFPKERLSRALSVFGLGVPIGSGLAMIIGGPIVQALVAAGPRSLPLIGGARPWQIIFLAVGLPGLLLGLLVLLVVREPERRTAAAETAHVVRLREVLDYMIQHRAIYAPIFLGMGCYALFGYGAASWYPAFLQRVHGFSIAESGLFLGLSTLVFGIGGAIGSGWLSDRQIARGRADGHLRVGMVYALGLMICGAIGPLVPIQWLSLLLVSASAAFIFTWLGACTALVQIVTPNRMRGRISAIYLFVINLISLGLGPTAVAFATDRLFGRDDAVGQSLALVAVVSLGLAIAFLQIARRPVIERAAP